MTISSSPNPDSQSSLAICGRRAQGPRLRHLARTLYLILCVSLIAACDSPAPTVPPDSGLFSDDFSRDAGLWETFDEEANASANIADGRMLVTVNTPSTVTFTVAAVNLSDFNLTVTTTQLGGGLANGYGIIFHYLDPQNFYRFDISGDSLWGFSRRQNDQWIQIVELTSSPAIRPGYESNALQIITRNNTFEFYANGALLGSATDSHLTLGRIGLFASTFDDSNTQIAFDDLKIVNP